MKISIQYLFISLLISSCSKDDTISTIKNEDIQGVWRVIAFENSNGSLTTITEKDTIFVVFESNGEINGRSHGMCGNYFSSHYSLLADSKIKINPIGSTEAGCPDSRYWEVIFALENAYKCELNNFLILYYNESAVKLRLQRIK